MKESDSLQSKRGNVIPLSDIKQAPTFIAKQYKSGPAFSLHPGLKVVLTHFLALANGAILLLSWWLKPLENMENCPATLHGSKTSNCAGKPSLWHGW